jgi:hypothetical protein
MSVRLGAQTKARKSAGGAISLIIISEWLQHCDESGKAI